MRLVLMMASAAVLLAACADMPLGKLQDGRMDPGAPRPGSAAATDLRR